VLILDIEYKENYITSDDYLLFERRMGDPQTSIEQAERSIARQLYSVAAVKSDEIVGIARLVGDAAIFWCVVDVWVLPEYQGQGIGRNMVNMLIQHVKDNSFPDTLVTVYLMCAKDKEGFYEKLGFHRHPNDLEGAGMEMLIRIK
jgi:GNAT superfamily N-acetyltransferase